MIMPEEQHICPEPMDLQTAVAVIRVAQVKDIEAVRSEIEIRFNANKEAISAAFESQKAAVQAAFESQKALVDKSFVTQQAALDLKTADNAKHFSDLNGEASRLKDMQQNYLPREVAAQRFERIESKLDDLKAWRDVSLGKQSMIAAIVSVIISLMFIVLNIFLSKH